MRPAAAALGGEDSRAADKNYHPLLSLFKKGFIADVNAKYTSNQSTALLLATEAGAGRIVGPVCAA